MLTVSYPISLEKAQEHNIQVMPMDSQVHNFPFSEGVNVGISSHHFKALRILSAVCKWVQQVQRSCLYDTEIVGKNEFLIIQCWQRQDMGSFFLSHVTKHFQKNNFCWTQCHHDLH